MIDMARAERLWKACGWERKGGRHLGEYAHWANPDGELRFELPSPDLNALFQWAVPAVERKLGVSYLSVSLSHRMAVGQKHVDWLCRIGEGKLQTADTPAEALFQVCEKALGLDK